MAQKAKKFKGKVRQTVQLGYLLYLPEDYDTDTGKRWPLIVFLHGMGKRGDDLELVKKHGPAKILDAEEGALPELTSFIVVSPQCPADSFWAAETAALNALLDEVMARYAVDASRVYLTGLSMGGYGTWHLAVESPQRFAAIAPICGGAMFYVNLANRIGALKDVPVWAFHGARDRVVNVAETADLVYALKQAGGDVQLTIYPEADHDSWTATYNSPELYRWFLSHCKA